VRRLKHEPASQAFETPRNGALLRMRKRQVVNCPSHPLPSSNPAGGVPLLRARRPLILGTAVGWWRPRPCPNGPSKMTWPRQYGPRPLGHARELYSYAARVEGKATTRQSAYLRSIDSIEISSSWNIRMAISHAPWCGSVSTPLRRFSLAAYDAIATTCLRHRREIEE